MAIEIPKAAEPEKPAVLEELPKEDAWDLQSVCDVTTKPGTIMEPVDPTFEVVGVAYVVAGIPETRFFQRKAKAP